MLGVSDSQYSRLASERAPQPHRLKDSIVQNDAIGLCLPSTSKPPETDKGRGWKFSRRAQDWKYTGRIRNRGVISLGSWNLGVEMKLRFHLWKIEVDLDNEEDG